MSSLQIYLRRVSEVAWLCLNISLKHSYTLNMPQDMIYRGCGLGNCSRLRSVTSDGNALGVMNHHPFGRGENFTPL